MPAPHVVVVGSGIGGLVTGAKLAKKGAKVTILEKNNTIGGRAQSVSFGGCRFDSGPSLLLFPDEYKETFKQLGMEMEKEVPINLVDPPYRVYFGDGTNIEFTYDADVMASRFEQMEEGAGEKYKEWLEASISSLRGGVEEFIKKDYNKWGDITKLNLINLIKMLIGAGPVELLGQHYGRLASRFKDPRIIAALTFQDLYIGLSPYNAPGVFSLLAATELVDQVWYPMGGFTKVTQALRKAVESQGGEIHLNSPVSHVTVEQPKQQTTDADEAPPPPQVTSVSTLSGDVIKCDAVVSNVDVPLSYTLLGAGEDVVSTSCDGTVLPKSPSEMVKPSGDTQAKGPSEQQLRDVQQAAEKKYNQITGLDYSAGVISFYWAIDGLVEQLSHHTLFLSNDAKQAWDRAKSSSEYVQFPNFYVHTPRRTDPSAVDGDLDSVMVLLPVACIQEIEKQQGKMSQEQLVAAYEKLVEVGRQKIIDTMMNHGIDIKDRIKEERILTPPQWKQRYALQHGCAFGLSHGITQLAVFRPSMTSDIVDGLYFTGSSTRPGNGVPLVMMGARQLADQVADDLSL